MNANKNVSIQQMAFNLGYSYDYFRQLFVEKMGMSAKKYLVNLKITNAKEYLLNTQYSVSKISRITGFSSPSHLCTVFKENIGLTPNEYRISTPLYTSRGCITTKCTSTKPYFYAIFDTVLLFLKQTSLFISLFLL